MPSQNRTLASLFAFLMLLPASQVRAQTESSIYPPDVDEPQIEIIVIIGGTC